MPNFPIVDTHLHIWDPKHLRYPWLDGNDLLNQPYLLADYNRATGPVQVEKMVFLQCEVEPSQFMQEAEWVTAQARIDPRIQALCRGHRWNWATPRASTWKRWRATR